MEDRLGRKVWNYAGDTELERLLRRAGSSYDAQAVRRLLAGTLVTPVDPDEALWRLIAPDPSPLLREQLAALREQLAAERPLAAERDDTATRTRVAQLRAELERRGVDGFVIPHADEYQSEYVPLQGRRLAWLTGFTGSAGLAVVLRKDAAMFVDGRYILQVKEEVDSSVVLSHHQADMPVQDWIVGSLEAGQKLGYDPWLHPPQEVDKFRTACERAGGALLPCAGNPVDAVWRDRPPPPLSPMVPHELRFAGQSSSEKRAQVARTLASSGLQAAVLTAPDSIAWLLNIRGRDVPHTPLPLSYAIITREARVDLFCDQRKISPGLDAHLGKEVRMKSFESFGEALEQLGRSRATVLCDPARSPAAVLDRLEASGAAIVRGQDPCALPKARKNQVEILGARAAHGRDGAAVCRFLAWLAREAPAGRLTERDTAAYLEGCRRKEERFREPSFPTISAAGSHGAIVHYRVSPRSNRRLEAGSLYLIDSGGQYLDGTTDITRTVAIGPPSPEHRARFTLVLKGHITLATARFPNGTTGPQLDILARHALWQAGLDYDHGTGHGVGSYLGVHEGPQRISKSTGSVPLEAGMIISNEPGYYKAGAYGIRIENLVLVVPSEPREGDEREMLAFETLTMAPLDRALIDPALLTPDERAWVDGYHARVLQTVGPLLKGEALRWLHQATAPLPTT